MTFFIQNKQNCVNDFFSYERLVPSIQRNKMLVFLGVGNFGGIKFFILFANMDTLSHTHVKNYAKCISYYINILLYRKSS